MKQPCINNNKLSTNNTGNMDDINIDIYEEET